MQAAASGVVPVEKARACALAQIARHLGAQRRAISDRSVPLVGQDLRAIRAQNLAAQPQAATINLGQACDGGLARTIKPRQKGTLGG